MGFTFVKLVFHLWQLSLEVLNNIFGLHFLSFVKDDISFIFLIFYLNQSKKVLNLAFISLFLLFHFFLRIFYLDFYNITHSIHNIWLLHLIFLDNSFYLFFQIMTIVLQFLL